MKEYVYNAVIQGNYDYNWKNKTTTKNLRKKEEKKKNKIKKQNKRKKERKKERKQNKTKQNSTHTHRKVVECKNIGSPP